MSRNHLPLIKWFWAIYLVACDKRGISTLTLTGKVEGCYETAWNMLRRICTEMEIQEECYTLCSIIEFDDFYFGSGLKGKIESKGGRTRENQAVFVAVFKDDTGHPVYLRLQVSKNLVE